MCVKRKKTIEYWLTLKFKNNWIRIINNNIYSTLQWCCWWTSEDCTLNCIILCFDGMLRHYNIYFCNSIDPSLQENLSAIMESLFLDRLNDTKPTRLLQKRLASYTHANDENTLIYTGTYNRQSRKSQVSRLVRYILYTYMDAFLCTNIVSLCFSMADSILVWGFRICHACARVWNSICIF